MSYLGFSTLVGSDEVHREVHRLHQIHVCIPHRGELQWSWDMLLATAVAPIRFVESSFRHEADSNPNISISDHLPPPIAPL